MPAPPVPPTGHAPDSNERLLAVVAHLGSLPGPWLFVPVLIYFLKRDTSRFVAHHAARALVVQLGFIGLYAAGAALGLALLAVHVAPVPEPLVLLTSMGMLAAACVLPLVYVVLHVLAAAQAFQGKCDHRGLLGRASDEILRRDPDVQQS